MKADSINSAISFFKKRDKKDLKVNAKGYEEVGKYNYPKASKYYRPDIEARDEDSTDFACVEEKFKKGTLHEDIQKWILLSIKAKRSKGKFFLFVPKKDFDSYDTVVNNLKLNLELVSMN